jgi:polar amino acid transport system substrate-binding protein
MKLAAAVVGTSLLMSLTACGSDDQSATSSSGTSDSGSLKFGWAELSGYAHRDPGSGDIEGLYVDVMKNVADDMGVEIEFVEDSWPTLVLGIDAGKYDVSIAGITDERREQVGFTCPIIQSDFTFAVKDGTDWEGIEDLDQPGNTIAVTTGSNTDQALTPLVKDAKILRIRDVGGALLSVSRGTADAMAGVRDYLIASTANASDMKILDSEWGLSLQGIFVGKNDDERLAQMNEEAERLIEEGVVQEAIDKFSLEGVEVPESCK